MRRIILFDRISADGCFSDRDGGLDWAVPDPEFEKGVAGMLGGARGAILFGRRTYESFESFWPHALDDANTAQDPHGPRRTRELRAFAVWINEAEKIVFSRTRPSVSWQGSRLVREFEPRAVAALKAEPGGDMLVFGSGSIATLLAQHGLIDEYQLLVGPLLLGSARPWLGALPAPQRLALVEAKPFASGNVLLRYHRAR